MKIFADLHLHSKYARATSKDLSLENLEKFAKIKGLNLLGTGDFSHPLWFKELKANLKESGEGIYQYRDKSIFFLLQNEIDLTYLQDGKTRKIHFIVLAPNFEILEQLNSFLEKKGNLKADGRPIFTTMNSPEFVESVMQISKDIMIIPSHAWTPWFGIFGSKSGFNSLKECFQDQTKNIFAIETGMSSDPAMNWRLSFLDDVSILSFSDAHSFWPWRMGREATVFELKDFDYKNLAEAIKNKDKSKILFTVEVDPSYGKYHWDGHRKCNVSLDPKESKKYKNICPVCKRSLTIGVLNRIEELADREEGFVPKNAISFKTILPLSELIAGVHNTQVFSKKVWEEYNKLIKDFGNEFHVLLEASHEKLKLIGGEKLAESIIKNREGKIRVQPGYDGIYGIPIFDNREIKMKIPQRRLSEF
jgi:uncharacterized protein (TIGR00375 family)